MRELKFRAWIPKDTGYQTYSGLYPVASISPGIVTVVRASTFARSDFPMGCVDIEQSTGLRDRKGVEIYEGDIVRRIHELAPDFVGAVKWIHRTMLSWSLSNLDGDDWVLLTDDVLEVIGNVHENPELLKAAK